MQFTISLLTSVAAGLCLVSALPSVKRQTLAGELEICTGTYFGGECDYLLTPNEDCVAFPYDFQYDVSSVAFLGGWECTFFYDTACDAYYGDFFTIANVTDLADFGVNNQLNSAQCTLPDN